ncbi:NUDIX domain-containing protein [Methanosarcina sp. UBA411]|uniref:NUDIX domain-containing protein n=1 Tax=Methanosarcina sp. UBA411 TaxID=1915589 RepID=UPI0025F09F80|nr:NUDIX domain-containing protein [Methanosarcina sp. UBA411]
MSTPNATSIPKGNEKPLYTAKRELKEETGFEVDGEFIDLVELNSPDTRWCMYRLLKKT